MSLENMKYAIIRLKGQQYMVKEGDTLLVDFQKGEKPEAEVLMLKTDSVVAVGTPVVDKASVKLSVVDKEVKGTKVHVRKYKSKSKYRKHVGFRPKLTRVKVEKLY